MQRQLVFAVLDSLRNIPARGVPEPQPQSCYQFLRSPRWNDLEPWMTVSPSRGLNYWNSSPNTRSWCDRLEGHMKATGTED